MKETHDSKNVLEDDTRFDRLVDGEMTLDEYQALLASLDDEPGGWRRCALAFLEGQALKFELNGVLRGLDLRSKETAVHQTAPASRRTLSTAYSSHSAHLRM